MISNFDVLGYVDAASKQPKYKTHFESVSVANVAAALELMITNGSYRADDKTAELFGIDEANEGTKVALINAISVARILYAAYVKFQDQANTYETVPFVIDLAYETGLNKLHQPYVKLKGFNIYWLVKPVSPSDIKEGLLDILNNSEIILTARSITHGVSVEVGPVPGLYSHQQMIELIDYLLKDKGYSYTVVSSEMDAADFGEEAVDGFARLFKDDEETNTQA